MTLAGNTEDVCDRVVQGYTERKAGQRLTTKTSAKHAYGLRDCHLEVCPSPHLLRQNILTIKPSILSLLFRSVLPEAAA